ncbi:MAG: response regulator [Gammaproteobacteria bacterium]|nr:response regulator [Gammaproteobacteria bacterium]
MRNLPQIDWKDSVGEMKKMLIAEDEVHAREALAAFFESQGFEVRCASDGEQALNIGNEFVPDVLITDWLLEGEFSGVGVARALAQAAPHTAIILVSGHPIAELRAITGDLEVEAYMEKPISLFDLNAVVERAAQKEHKKAAT